MSLLTIANLLANNVGLEETSQVISSAAREWQEAVEMSNAVGDELARRVDWGVLNKTDTLTGDGTDRRFELGEGIDPSAGFVVAGTYTGNEFSRITEGLGVTVGGNAVRALSRSEWASLTPVEGTPRYFLLEAPYISFWPYLATGDEVLVNYQTIGWCSTGGPTWNADEDTSKIDEDLMLKGLIVRWRRQKGMEFADYEAEYEATLLQMEGFDSRARY